MIRVIFLDIDNTLLDFDAYVKVSMQEGFEKFGYPSFEPWMYDVFTVKNNQLWEALERKEITYQDILDERWNIIFRELGIQGDGKTFEKFFKGNLFHSAIQVEGAMDILSYLSERYIVCAASNGPFQQQLNRLTISGMKPYFSHIFISEDIGVSKPSEDFYDRCMQRLNLTRRNNGEDEIERSEVIMIGDSLTSDMTGARNYGMKMAYFTRGRKRSDYPFPIDYIFDHLVEIKDFL